ncbi:response regulator [Geomonas sp. Red32]|uniref:hybrid sensor histidine kinase/response regulator n=1 Tax=Geomonas sp. Red32 TaxID=2912856 RepID=UPI00202CBD5C|nr:response regulator [Geomonas sp. Red32]MCM0083770.1 response regulator [Geomonas sp. Red32]
MPEVENLLRELLETFRAEAQEQLAGLGELLVELERGEPAAQGRLVEALFRRMHTLKGAAHAVNLVEVAKECQELEQLLASVKRGELALGGEVFDRLHGGVNLLARDIEAAAPAPRPRQEPAGAPGVATAAPPSRPLPSPPAAQPETVRVSAHLLESLLLQAEELASAKLNALLLREEVGQLAAELAGRAGERGRALDLAREAIRRGGPKGEPSPLAPLLEQLAAGERLTEGVARQLEARAERHLWGLEAAVDPLLAELKKLQLLPFSWLTSPLGKLVRDLGRELGKEADLVTPDPHLEVDRRILAELKEPLLHLLRNVMDHGIEPPAERRGAGKRERGAIEIRPLFPDANRLQVVVSDDGRGIDLDAVRGAALKAGTVTPEALERLSGADAVRLIFESGVSTSPMVTNLSGRGVGLAIVRESVEKLGGDLAVASEPGKGTSFTITLPLSFSRMEGLLVETGGRLCLIPAQAVELGTRVAVEEIRSVENRETVLLGGEVVPLVSLARVLELPEGLPPAGGFQQLVVLNAAGRRLAFAVQRVIGVQEMLVKPLGSQLSRVRNVVGAAVLGDGKVVPVANPADLFRSALSRGDAATRVRSAGEARQLSVLVAEDSITSRTLLKNILESSGFRVATAVDGQDALDRLKGERFDLVVSDVEMPRLDGFELTAAIRRDNRWAGLPVVLVTGLESRAQRERGIEVGADAYLVKSSFDQSSLIEVIGKLT